MNGETTDDLLVEVCYFGKSCGYSCLRNDSISGSNNGRNNSASRQTSRNEDRRRKNACRNNAAHLNALEGKGVHVVTVNEYLAKRDCEEMGQVYAMLGLTTGVILNDYSQKERQEAYNCDITYVTNKLN